MARRLTPQWVGLLVGVVSGWLALGPVLLHRGFALSYDLVFVPRPPITDSMLGVDGSVPRAVPNDLVVALLSRVIPADVVQKLVLLAVFALGAWGVARLTRTAVAALVATVTFVWNPYVYERLVIGHWGYLVGYALLPWVAAAAIGARRGGRRPVAELCLAVALTGLAGSTSLVLAGVTALAVLAVPGRNARAGGRWVAAGAVMAAFLGSAAAWLVPALTRDHAIPADPAGIGAFAAKADTPLGVLPSVLGLGGIWNEAVWPAERGALVVAVAGLAFVVAALVVGGGRLARAWDGAGAGLLVAGGVGLLLAVAGTVPGVESVLRAVVLHVAGGGLLRDGQKFVALLGLPVALCAGLMAESVQARLGRVAMLLALAPLVLLPSLAWGAGGRLTPVQYPADWAHARAAVAKSPGDVAVFPFRLYRRFSWNHDRVLLDPMPRYLPARVVVNDDLPLTGLTVRGEDPRAARIRAAVRDGADLPEALRRAGVRLVVIHRHETDPDGSVARLADLPVRYAGAGLEVRSVPGVPAQRRSTQLPWGLVLAAATIAACGVLRLIPPGGRAATLRKR